MDTNEDLNRTVQDALKSGREESGLSLDEACSIAGVDIGKVTLQRYESGERKIPATIFFQLIRTYERTSKRNIFHELLPKLAHQTIKPTYLNIQEAKAQILQIAQDNLNLDLATRQLLKVLTIATRSAIGAVFRYRWEIGGVLSRLYEVGGNRGFDQRIESMSGDPLENESYYPAAGRYYTDRAWQSHDQRYIKNYPEDMLDERGKVNEISFNRHRHLLGLGEIQSTMYGVLRCPDQLYAFRFFNRSDFPSTNLDPLQFHTLTRLCDYASEVFAEFELSKYLGSLNDVVAEAETGSDAQLQELRNQLVGIPGVLQVRFVSYMNMDPVEICPKGNNKPLSRSRLLRAQRNVDIHVEFDDSTRAAEIYLDDWDGDSLVRTAVIVLESAGPEIKNPFPDSERFDEHWLKERIPNTLSVIRSLGSLSHSVIKNM